MVEGKTYVIDLDLRSYFDTVKHHIVMEKVAQRVSDEGGGSVHSRKRKSWAAGRPILPAIGS
jgi:RNA-directed DNA polymerase